LPATVLVRLYCGPCPGWAGSLQAQLGFPQRRRTAAKLPGRKSPTWAISE
jgi:hypothetical protein